MHGGDAKAFKLLFFEVFTNPLLVSYSSIRKTIDWWLLMRHRGQVLVDWSFWLPLKRAKRKQFPLIRQLFL